jgi:hypothetical protein
MKISSNKIKKVRFDDRKNNTTVFKIDKEERKKYFVYNKIIIDHNIKNRHEIIRKLKLEL